MGRALAGIALALSGPGAAMAVMAALMAGAVAALARLRVPGQQAPTGVPGGSARRVVEDLLGACGSIRRQRAPAPCSSQEDGGKSLRDTGQR